MFDTFTACPRLLLGVPDKPWPGAPRPGLSECPARREQTAKSVRLWTGS